VVVHCPLEVDDELPENLKPRQVKVDDDRRFKPVIHRVNILEFGRNSTRFFFIPPAGARVIL